MPQTFIITKFDASAEGAGLVAYFPRPSNEVNVAFHKNTCWNVSSIARKQIFPYVRFAFQLGQLLTFLINFDTLINFSPMKMADLSRRNAAAKLFQL